MNDIAIIGMAGRFPDARNIHALWDNLCAGKESIRTITFEELESSDVPRTVWQDASYVRSAAMPADIEVFASRLFGMSAVEADLLDPQQRLLLECAWDAMENAGYDVSQASHRIGVFAGSALNTYLLFNLLRNRQTAENRDLVQLNLASGPDFLATRISYKLNLSGPSHTVQCACSTSLAAVHIASQSLRSHECDMALAGGVALNLRLRYGYTYLEGGMMSPDGHCRAFDRNAQGTVFGNGAGIVLLKRLEDAVQDGDYIYAKIVGSAINNDAAAKVGYAAPSVEGQSNVIRAALQNSRISSDTIGYVETHGTGTSLGDPIEIRALARAFALEGNPEEQSCALGTIKPNIGHLDAASGIASLIKATIALDRRTIPPCINFEELNPHINLDGTPFFVNTQLRDWDTKLPRRAGVSSFGVGGTNVHVVLEEASNQNLERQSPFPQLLVLSADSDRSVKEFRESLVDLVQRDRRHELSDVAWMLSSGRKLLPYRQAFLCHTLDQLSVSVPLIEHVCQNENQHPTVAFLFPGEGAQWVNMGRDIYDSEPFFRELMDTCFGQVLNRFSFDLKSLLYPPPGSKDNLTKLSDDVVAIRLGIFCVEYCLAKLWDHWGVRPSAVVGYGVGEYAAACVSGIFNLDDALHLVWRSGTLIQHAAPGSMLAVPTNAEEAELIAGTTLDIAAINSSSLCVLSGGRREIDELRERLRDEGFNTRLLAVAHALHSRAIDPLLDRFREEFIGIRLHSPECAFLSGATGEWLGMEAAIDPKYWCRQLRGTIFFADAARALTAAQYDIALEVGPGETLSRGVRHALINGSETSTLSSLKGPHDQRESLLAALGHLWALNNPIVWNNFYRSERRHHVPLPARSFEKHRHWISPDTPASSPQNAGHDIDSKSAQYHSRPDLASSYSAPSTSSERQLTTVVEEVLSVQPIGLDDNFFDLGGDSLLAIGFIDRVKAELGITLTTTDIYEALTVRSLAKLIDSASAANRADHPSAVS